MHIQGALLHALGHGERILRATVGSAIAAVVASTGLLAWPELVPALTQCLGSLELAAVEGGLDALYQVPPPSRPSHLGYVRSVEAYNSRIA